MPQRKDFVLTEAQRKLAEDNIYFIRLFDTM